MPVLTQFVPSGPSGRSVVNHDLSRLFAAVTSARVADRQARGRLRWDDPFRPDAYRLASSLRAYARALEGYRLPVPPVIRDELRLRSGLPL
ncbi:hypothetical protein GCM10009630_62760 [Kribbella jejuensis]|uniref:Uncharacterized protein n=1 Tax=Kribbella jejuensis TaxID=236068 RepID=A0A542EAN7_9ACTN|nr:hypothetical protein FB475_5341 [Kribbella jejuensis]